MCCRLTDNTEISSYGIEPFKANTYHIPRSHSPQKPDLEYGTYLAPQHHDVASAVRSNGQRFLCTAGA